MLAVKSYSDSYIKSCEARMTKQLAAYKAVGGSKSGLDAFEPQFFSHLVLVLNHYFVHRTRAIEGKDGNPLNEVRILCTSLLQHGGVFTPDKMVRYRPADSVLGLQMGDRITLDAESFQKLYLAYFQEIRARFA